MLIAAVVTTYRMGLGVEGVRMTTTVALRKPTQCYMHCRCSIVASGKCGGFAVGFEAALLHRPLAG